MTIDAVNPEGAVSAYEDEHSVTVHDADKVEIYLLATGSDGKPVEYNTDKLM